MEDLDRIDEELRRLDVRRQENIQLMNELRNLIDEIEHREDFEDLLHFHELQLMSFEEHHIILSSCQCHKWYIREFCMSIFSNMHSPIEQLAIEKLQSEPDLIGCYFVSSNISSMFFDLNPVFMDRSIGNSHGMIISVNEMNKNKFIRAICRVGDLGIMPCEYLRYMTLTNFDTLLLSCPDWFNEFMNILSIHYATTMVNLDCSI